MQLLDSKFKTKILIFIATLMTLWTKPLKKIKWRAKYRCKKTIQKIAHLLFSSEMCVYSMFIWDTRALDNEKGPIVMKCSSLFKLAGAYIVSYLKRKSRLLRFWPGNFNLKCMPVSCILKVTTTNSTAQKKHAPITFLAQCHISTFRICEVTLHSLQTPNRRLVGFLQSFFVENETWDYTKLTT